MEKLRCVLGAAVVVNIFLKHNVFASGFIFPACGKRRWCDARQQSFIPRLNSWFVESFGRFSPQENPIDSESLPTSDPVSEAVVKDIIKEVRRSDAELPFYSEDEIMNYTPVYGKEEKSKEKNDSNWNFYPNDVDYPSNEKRKVSSEFQVGYNQNKRRPYKPETYSFFRSGFNDADKKPQRKLSRIAAAYDEEKTKRYQIKMEETLAKAEKEFQDLQKAAVIDTQIKPEVETLESPTLHLQESTYTAHEQNSIVKVEPQFTSHENQLVHEPAAGPLDTLSFAPKVKKNLSLEEEIATVLSLTANAVFDERSRLNYQHTRENLQEIVTSTRSILKEVEDEKKKPTTGQPMWLEARSQMEVETDKIAEAQAKVNEEIRIISSFLQYNINIEKDRQFKMLILLSALEKCIAMKDPEAIVGEKNSTDIMLINNKKNNTFFGLNEELSEEEKAKLLSLDDDILTDLHKCADEIRSIVKETNERQTKIENTRKRVRYCDVTSGLTLTILEAMENDLLQAEEDILGYEELCLSIRDRIIDTFITKKFILGEPIPDSLKKIAKVKKMKEDAIQQQMDFRKQKQKLDHIENASNDEVLSILTESASAAAVAGGKTVLFSLKTVLDTLTGKEVTEATSSALETSAEMFKGFQRQSIMSKKYPADKRKTSPTIIAKDLTSKLKDTGKNLEAFGQIFTDNIAYNKNTKHANDSAKETGMSVLTALHAIKTLGTRHVETAKENIKRGIV